MDETCEISVGLNFEANKNKWSNVTFKGYHEKEFCPFQPQKY
jgi:hypothetical protein